LGFIGKSIVLNFKILGFYFHQKEFLICCLEKKLLWCMVLGAFVSNLLLLLLSWDEWLWEHCHTQKLFSTFGFGDCVFSKVLDFLLNVFGGVFLFLSWDECNLDNWTSRSLIQFVQVYPW
jgi:hypothetical protein